jgi:hypothetical protein
MSVVRTTEGCLAKENKANPFTKEMAEGYASDLNKMAEKMGLKTRYEVAFN